MATATNNEVRVENQLSNAAYHRRPEVSNSMLSDFIDSPELYYGRYVAQTIPRKKKTAVMQFGDLVHESVLLGIDTQAVEVPASALDKGGKRNGKGFKEFASKHHGKALLLKEEYERLRNAVDAVWSHPRASEILSMTDAAVEQSIFWTDEETGLRLRCRPDCRRLSLPLLADLKTTGDASREAVAKSMHKFGYSRQRPFYGAGVKALTRIDHDFVFVFVESDEPHRVRCYELDPRPDRALTKGYEDFRSGLERLAECYRTDRWTEPGWDQVLTLDLPNWAYSNQWEYQDGDGTTTE